MVDTNQRVWHPLYARLISPFRNVASIIARSGNAEEDLECLSWFSYRFNECLSEANVTLYVTTLWLVVREGTDKEVCKFI